MKNVQPFFRQLPLIKCASVLLALISFFGIAFTLSERTQAKAARTTLMQTSVAVVSAASFEAAPVAPDAIVSAFGVSLATRVEVAVGLPLPTLLAGTTVKLKDSTGTERLAPLFFVAPSQINYLVPSGTASGLATVTVINGINGISTGTVQIAKVSPGLFAANSTGQGVAAAVAVRVKSDGRRSSNRLPSSIKRGNFSSHARLIWARRLNNSSSSSLAQVSVVAPTRPTLQCASAALQRKFLMPGRRAISWDSIKSMCVCRAVCWDAGASALF